MSLLPAFVCTTRHELAGAVDAAQSDCMRKDHLIRNHGGTEAEFARRLGIKRSSVRAWPVDDEGHITSRAAADRVLGYLCRLRAQQLREQGLEVDPIEADYVYLPEQCLE